MKKLLILTTLLATTASAKETCIQKITGDRACFKTVYGTYYATHDALEAMLAMPEVQIKADIRVIPADEYLIVDDLTESKKGNGKDKDKDKGGKGTNVGSKNGSGNGNNNGNGNTVINAMPGSTIIIINGGSSSDRPVNIE